ncbi:hypothetical protein K3495_g7982 [Podosphaera aphanis]|nr:hypothetical protein K3495_g7982 [Podosphaera aphanis]
MASLNKVLPDCTHRRLIWPASYPPTYNPSRQITIQLKNNKKINIQHQRDALLNHQKNRENNSPVKLGLNSINMNQKSPLSLNAIDQSIDLPQLIQPDDLSQTPTPLTHVSLHTTTFSSFLKDQALSLQRMTKELNLNFDLQIKQSPATLCRKQIAKPKMKKDYSIDIAEISGPALHLNGRRPDNELFTTFIYEIDVLQKEKYQEKEALDNQIALDTAVSRLSPNKHAVLLASLQENLIDEPQVLEHYPDFSDVFPKAESDVLPPHRSYDHKIVLEGEGEKALKYSPLYKMSLEELETAISWITDNLNKGFIEPSQSPFAAPILFVRKANGSLRLCIDFRTLNALKRKDRYPLLLIDETLARLAGAKIFTKLDIRQAFHRIHMDPSSEEYTTFRTRYSAYKCKVLPFGLTNGPATYQRYMNDVLFVLKSGISERLRSLVMKLLWV